MGRLTLNGVMECEVGGVYHVCYFSPEEIKEIINRRGKENVPLNGQIFPYIAHYLTTGDLIYPAHEGESHISSLLEEMGRLDLVRKLFPNQLMSKGGGNSEALRASGKTYNPSSGSPPDGSAAPLRIRTKNERWVSKALSRLRWTSKAEDKNRNIHQVYRPPPQTNKGTTLVVVKSSLQGSSHIRVHGPSVALQSLMPNAVPVTSRPTHHHLNSHLVPPESSAHSVIRDLEGQGFVVTVRSSRVEDGTGALITQWLLYRGSSKKLLSLSSLSSRRTASLGKALGTSKKTMHSLSISRKKNQKQCSTNGASGDKGEGSSKKSAGREGSVTGRTVAGDDNDRLGLIQQMTVKNSDSSRCLRSSPSSTSSTFRSIISHSKHSYLSSGSTSSFSSSSSSSSTSKSQRKKENSKPLKEKNVDTKISVNSFNNKDFRSTGNKNYALNDPIVRPYAKNLILNQPFTRPKANDFGLNQPYIKPNTNDLDLTQPYIRPNANELGLNQSFFRPNTNDFESTGPPKLGHKSLSSSSLASKPIGTLKSSPSLWDLCSKSSVKKVFTLIF